jgi:hypothetical protein
MVVHYLTVLVDHSVYADQATFCDFVRQIAVKFRKRLGLRLELKSKEEADYEEEEGIFFHGWGIRLALKLSRKVFQSSFFSYLPHLVNLIFLIDFLHLPSRI